MTTEPSRNQDRTPPQAQPSDVTHSHQTSSNDETQLKIQNNTRTPRQINHTEANSETDPCIQIDRATRNHQTTRTARDAGGSGATRRR